MRVSESVRVKTHVQGCVLGKGCLRVKKFSGSNLFRAKPFLQLNTLKGSLSVFLGLSKPDPYNVPSVELQISTSFSSPQANSCFALPIFTPGIWSKSKSSGDFE